MCGIGPTTCPSIGAQFISAPPEKAKRLLAGCPGPRAATLIALGPHPPQLLLNYIELVEKGRKLAGAFLVVGSVGDELDNKGQDGRDE